MYDIEDKKKVLFAYFSSVHENWMIVYEYADCMGINVGDSNYGCAYNGVTDEWLVAGPRGMFSINCNGPTPMFPASLGAKDCFPKENADNPVPTNEQTTSKVFSHYYKDVRHLQYIDVYRVIQLFNVTDPSLQHLCKKALCAGKRGHKDYRKDLTDILASATRALEMYDEDQQQLIKDAK